MYHNPMSRQRLSLEQASGIAVQQIPGQIIYTDMDMEDGTLVYEIFIMTPENWIYEVKVAANTGRIIKIEQETDFD